MTTLTKAALLTERVSRNSIRQKEFPACNGTPFQQEYALRLWINANGALTPAQAATQAGTTLKP